MWGIPLKKLLFQEHFQILQKKIHQINCLHCDNRDLSFTLACTMTALLQLKHWRLSLKKNNALIEPLQGI